MKSQEYKELNRKLKSLDTIIAIWIIGFFLILFIFLWIIGANFVKIEAQLPPQKVCHNEIVYSPWSYNKTLIYNETSHEYDAGVQGYYFFANTLEVCE